MELCWVCADHNKGICYLNSAVLTTARSLVDQVTQHNTGREFYTLVLHSTQELCRFAGHVGCQLVSYIETLVRNVGFP